MDWTGGLTEEKYATMCFVLIRWPKRPFATDIQRISPLDLRSVRTMDFEEKPDYKKLKKLFIKLFLKQKFEDNGLYDRNNCLIWLVNIFLIETDNSKNEIY